MEATADHIASVGQVATKPAAKRAHRRPRLPAPKYRTPLAAVRRFNGLVLRFTRQLLGGRDALSVVEHEMVRQTAAMVLRAEQLQAALIRGEPVDHDELIRVTSEMRRAVKALGLKPPRDEPPPAPPPGPWRSSVMRANEAGR